jgi:hypothetical protein
MLKITTTLVLFAFMLAAQADDTKLSSTYTDLSKDCKSTLKESELQDGQDGALNCKGPDGFSLFIFFSANNTHLAVRKASIQYAMENAITIANYEKAKIEWRMANSKPFAIIARSKELEPGGKNSPETLVARGVKGYESINLTVDAKLGARANDQIRMLVDGAYSKTRQ